MMKEKMKKERIKREERKEEKCNKETIHFGTEVYSEVYASLSMASRNSLKLYLHL